MAAKPLEGVRVLDFTWVRAGPWATRWLAVLGAEVIKVEWPDPRLAFNGRVGGVMAQGGGPNAGGHFNDQNADKLSITVNVRSPKGLAIIKDLMKVTDIVIENFSARVMSDWGLGYEVMSVLNPNIIYVSMAGFGQSGRHAAYTTMGPSVQALSGLTFLSGLPDTPPAGWGWSYMDDTGGLYGAICALTALHHRQMTGQGQHVDMSQVAAGITLTGPALLDLTANGRGARRAGYPPGNRAYWPGTPLLNNYRGRTVAPHNAYRTRGGDHFDWCAIACFDDEEWGALVGLMGSPSWATNAKFDTVEGRLAHQEELDAGIQSWSTTLEKYELMERCQAAGVRAAAVQSTEDRVEHDPQLRARRLFEPMTHPVVGTYPMQQAPFTLSLTPVLVTKTAPLLGEHNISILGGLLGIPWDDIRAGYDDGTLWPSHVPIEQYLLEAPTEPPTPPSARATTTAVQTTGRRENDGALGDLRVIEVGGEIGEWCAKLLADLGAEVIKIEPPAGAPEREIGPFYEDVPAADRSLHFWHYNTSKRSVTLDLQTTDGRALFRRLVDTADILLESCAPGYLPSLGLDYEALHATNARLVMCSLTPFGQTGPWRDYKTSDLIQLAAGGQMGECGYDEVDAPGQPPIAPGGGNAWHIGSHYAYIAITAALFHRGKTGEGQYIDASVHDACALTTEGGVTQWIYNHQVVKRQTGRHAAPQPSPRTQFLCADGRYVNTLMFGLRMSPAQLKVVAEWFDQRGLAEDLKDQKYENPELLNGSMPHIIAVAERFFAATPSDEVYHAAQQRGFPLGPVRAPEDVLVDEHFRDRGFFVRVEHPELGRTFEYPGAAAIYHASPWRISRRAPVVGEDNVAILGELGVTPAQLGVLREAGAV